MGGQGRYEHSMERESRMVHDNIRRGVQRQMEVGLLVWLILKNRSGSLLRLGVVVLIFDVLVTTPWQALCFC
jgi:hypothetical protein